MKIVCCCKRVPDTATRIKVASDGKGIETDGVQWVLNPYDEFAVEEAVRIKEAGKATEVIVVGVGPAESSQILKNALAMGADRAVLVKDDAGFRDPLATAQALADVIKSEGDDVGLVLCGRQSVDDQSLAVGPLLGTLLERPTVMDVTSVELGDGTVTVKREAEGRTEVIEAKLPAVLTAQKDLNEPRYASLKGILAAKKKPFEEREFAFGDAHGTLEKLAPPPERQAGKIVGEGADAVPELVRLLREEAKLI